jgi:hypothetical protein
MFIDCELIKNLRHYFIYNEQFKFCQSMSFLRYWKPYWEMQNNNKSVVYLPQLFVFVCVLWWLPHILFCFVSSSSCVPLCCQFLWICLFWWPLRCSLTFIYIQVKCRIVSRVHLYAYHVLLRRDWRYQREVIRICKSKKNRQHNAQKKSTKGQTTIYKIYAYETKDRVTRTPLKTGGELMCSGRVSSSCSTSGTRRVNLVSGGEEDGSYSLFC